MIGLDPVILYSLIGAGAVVAVIVLIAIFGKPMGGERSGDTGSGGPEG